MCPSSGYFDTPFGADGELASIPDASQVDGSVSYTDGWGVDYTLINTNPSYKAMPWGQFNQLYYDITSAIQVIQQGSPAAFITTSMNGGSPYVYPKGAVVSSGGVSYISLVGSNADTPPSAKWAVSFSGQSGSFTAGHIAVFADTNGTVEDGGAVPSYTLPAATSSVLGGVKPDGTIITNSAGAITVAKASSTAFGVVEVDNTSITSASGVISAVASVQSTFKNLKIIWASNTTLTLTADQLLMQNSSGVPYLAKSVSVTLNSASSGAGGLDTGSIAANTWYYVYGIYNGTTQSAVLSASSSGPTLPGGYTYDTGPIGAARTDGSSHFLGFMQFGRDWQYWVTASSSNLTAFPVIASGSAGSYTAESVSAVCPTAIAPKIKIQAYNENTGTALFCAPNASYGTTASPFPPLGLNGSGGSWEAEFFLESTSVYYQSNSAGGISCMGFTINI